jgi:tetratricopeptide (TPR) repeat protein
MGAPLAAAIAAVMVVAALVGACRRCWLDAQGSDEQQGLRNFLRWVRLGLIFPFCWWLGWNLVALLSSRSILPPLLVASGLSTGPSLTWPVVLLGNAAVLAVFLGAAWATVTFLWLLPALLKESESTEEFKPTAIAASLIALLLIVWPAWRGSIAGMTLVVLGWSALLAHGAIPRAGKPQPLYSRAIAHLKFGRYEQAEQAVIEELEKKEDDYDGWMMLAQMYAEHFREVAEAERTIHELCAQPGVGPFQVSRALNRLADWQLQIADDPAAARRTLADLCERLPDTTFAASARHRLRELPVSREEARQRRQPRTIRLPALSEGAMEGAASAPTPEQRLAFREQAARLSERLEVYPDETMVRERLARVLAEGLGEVDAGMRHLQILFAGSEPTHPRRTEWLGLLAAWTLNLRHDQAGARKLFEQIVREHPASPQALAARRHLNLLEQSIPLSHLRPESAPTRWLSF